jgi:hypothetical protein
MNLPSILVKRLVLAAVCDWLVGRTLTRMAIHMPKPPLLITIYQGLGWIWQLAATFSAILVMVILGWLSWHSFRKSGNPGLGIGGISLVALSILSLVTPFTSWLALAYHLCFVLVLVVLTWLGIQQYAGVGIKFPIRTRLAHAVVGLTLIVSQFFQIVPLFGEASGMSLPQGFGSKLFNFGEFLVILSAFLLWFAYGRGASLISWLVAGLPVMVYVAGRISSPAMTGILAIWSTGLSLYLPWFMYALALWLAGVTIIHSLRSGSIAGWAFLLLIAGGFTPQLTSQALFGLVALWLLAAPPDQFEEAGVLKMLEVLHFEKA